MAFDPSKKMKDKSKSSADASNVMSTLKKAARAVNPFSPMLEAGTAIGRALHVPNKGKAAAAGRKGYKPTATEKDRMMEVGMQKRAAGARVIGAGKPKAEKPMMPTKKPVKPVVGTGLSDLDKRAKKREDDYKESRDRHGDYYLALSGGFGSEPYKKPRKR